MECLKVNDCPFSDQLASARFRAYQCATPARDRTQLLSIVAYVLFAVATIFTIARLVARLAGVGFGWDDFVAVASYAPLVGFFVAGYFTLQNGMGKEIWTLSLGDIVDFTKVGRNTVKVHGQADRNSGSTLPAYFTCLLSLAQKYHWSSFTSGLGQLLEVCGNFGGYPWACWELP